MRIPHTARAWTTMKSTARVSRRSMLRTAIVASGLGTLLADLDAGEGVAASDAPVSPKENLKITKLETFLVKPRWLFLKVHTNAGIVGLGEPILEGRAKTCATAVAEIAPYLVGKDPRPVAHHWQAISPQTAKLLIKALEPYQPCFIEEPVQCQNVEVMADIARMTPLPIATGERIFTKWGFREILEKRAASILQPDLCHAGGITEVRLIAGMAEAYYASIAPHNPLGPISLAAGVQLAASIPNFLCQEQVTLGDGYLKNPFVVREGYLELPTGPGLGIELDEAALASKIDHDWRNRESYDPEDGSVVDW